MYDYSFFVFPALRAIEGHLKIVLHALNIPLGPKSSFNMFTKESNGVRYKIDQQFHDQISTIKVKKLEDAYNFYYNQRHSLFHWAEQGTPLDQTRLIENLGEARGLITDAFSIIEEYYGV
ncbi:mRNA endoribonuclease LS [compost metagenome]